MGSTIAISALDDTFVPTGDVFNTQTTDNLGSFDVEFDHMGYVSLESTGYYYNEVTGALSEAPLTLRSLFEIEGGGEQSAYVNALSHMSYQRVLELVQDGSTFNDAVETAEEELRAGLHVGLSTFEPAASAIEMSIAGGNNDANAYLLAVHAVLVEAARQRGDSVDANLQEIINSIASDLTDDGTLEADIVEELDGAQAILDTEAVEQALQERLGELGSTAGVPDIDAILDQDFDGYVNNDDCRPYDVERWTGSADLDLDGLDHLDCGGEDCDDDDSAMGACSWVGYEAYDYGWTPDFGDRNCHLYWDAVGTVYSGPTVCAGCLFTFNVTFSFNERESFDDGNCAGFEHSRDGTYIYGFIEDYEGFHGTYDSVGYYYDGYFATFKPYHGASFDELTGDLFYYQGWADYPYGEWYYTSYFWGSAVLEYW